jgi:hypothetical protein
MLTPTPSRPGRSRRRHWLSGAVTLLAALAAVIGLAGLQAPGALAGTARGAAVSAGAAARNSAAAGAAARAFATGGRTASARTRTVQPQRAASGKVTVGHSSKNDVSPKLRNIKPKPVTKRPRKVVPVLPIHPHGNGTDHVVQNKTAPAAQNNRAPPVQNKLAAPHIPSPELNFDGISYPGVSCFCAPPDTNGAVGATQYVQMVNEGIQVFDKNTGNSVLGPESITSLWNGFGGPCETSGEGDPVVAYDQIANRWVISQLAISAPTFVPNYECVAVSTTSDATGSYNRYAFNLGATFGQNFYDYPKLGVWPDGYYLSYNIFNSSGTAFLGPQPFALDRSAMLAGNPAAVISTGMLGPNDNQLQPAYLDGSTQPPAGAPNPYTEIGSNPDAWAVWRFHADFANPANSTFTNAGSLTPDPFTQLCPNPTEGVRGCVPQAGVPDELDALADRSMFRNAYRVLPNGQEALVGDMTVESNGVAGIRWWQIDNATSGTPAFVQQSTYQPDNTWRWMGSAAMDAEGNLTIGFSASSSSINPQIRYAGRLAGDPPNTLDQGETTLLAGTGSQTGTDNRWGDYSDLTVDPTDGCTFWYTNEYYTTTSAFNWRTRIGSFKFPNCTTGPTGTLAGTVTDASTGNPVANATVTTSLGTTTTDANGHYSIILPVGTYNATYSRFGYADDTESNLQITSGTTTTVNVALQPSPSVTVSGTITDGSGHGWPLYTRIDVAGDPDSPFFTNPITGQYSIQLPANASYDVTFTSQLPGYQPVEQTVDVGGTDMTHNVQVPVTSDCTAPGYSAGSPCVVVPGGLVEGNVSDLTTGDAINGATVTSNDMPSEKATTFATPNDPNNPGGFYWLFSSLTGSHSFTASDPQHSDDTETANVAADSTVRQDFKLGSAHLVISPSSISSTQVLGNTTTQTLSVKNDGTGPANVKLTGCCGSFQLLGPTGGHLTWVKSPPATGVQMRANNASGSGLAYPSEARWQSNTHTASDPSILVYEDDPFHPAPNGYVDQALQRLGLSYTAFYNGDFSDFENALTTGTWDTVIFADDDFLPPSSTLSALNNYATGGGKLIVDSWTVSLNPSPLWSTLGFQFGANDTGPNPAFWWQPDNPIFTHPNNVPQLTQPTGGRYGIYGQAGDPLSGFQALAGDTTAPAAGHARMILGNNDRTIFKGFTDGQWDQDLNGNGIRDDVELWQNMIFGIVNGFNVPWLAESPAQFTVPVGGTVNVTVTLSATTADQVIQPGTDTAQILVSSPDTPQTLNPVNVTMNVTPPKGWGKIAGTVNGEDCSGKTSPLRGVVFADGGKGYSFTLRTDANGNYAFWAPAGASPFTLQASASGWIPQTKTASIRGGKTTTVNFTLRPTSC